MRKLFGVMFCFALLSGCGSSSDSGSSIGTGGGSSSTYTLDGKIIGEMGKYSGKVCFDRNANKVCDEVEPAANATSDGTYSLKGDSADKSISLLAELTPIQPEAASLKTTERKSILESPAGQKVISSLTTIIKGRLDANPLLNVEAAKFEVMSELKIDADVDLFNPQSAETVSETGNKVFAVIDTMVNELNKLGIIFSNGFMSMIYSEINSQLTNIINTTPEDVVKDAIGEKTKDDFEKEIGDIDNTPKPVVKTAAAAFSEGLTSYGFTWDSTEGKDGFYFTYMIFNKTGMKSYFSHGENYKSALPTANGTIDTDLLIKINNDGSVDMSQKGIKTNTIINVTTIDISGKTIGSNPRFNQQSVTFSQGASMYKSDAFRYAKEKLDSIEWLQENYEKISSGDIRRSYKVGSVQSISNNKIEIRLQNGQNYNIILTNNHTYYVTKKDNSLEYNRYTPFDQSIIPLRKGSYKLNNGIYEFDNEDSTGMVIFPGKNGSSIFAGYVEAIPYEEQLILFNETAAKDIQSKEWIDTPFN